MKKLSKRLALLVPSLVIIACLAIAFAVRPPQTVIVIETMVRQCSTCTEAPIESSVRVRKRGNLALVLNRRTDKHGVIEVRVAPGHYLIEAFNAVGMKSSHRQGVIFAAAGKRSTVALVFHSRPHAKDRYSIKTTTRTHSTEATRHP